MSRKNKQTVKAVGPQPLAEVIPFNLPPEEVAKIQNKIAGREAELRALIQEHEEFARRANAVAVENQRKVTALEGMIFQLRELLPVEKIPEKE